MAILPKRRIKNPATQQEIDTTNRNAAIIGGALSTLLIPGGPLAGIGKKAIGQAFKKAGSIGNTKKPDTIGNRFKQSQAIMGKSPKDKPFGSRTSMLTQDGKTASTKNPMLGTVMGTSASTKYYRTLTKAIEQGPSKFFSSGRSPKTGITPNKRTLSKFSGHGALGGTSKGSQSFFKNKVLINTVELSNKEARKVLQDKLRKK